MNTHKHRLTSAQAANLDALCVALESGKYTQDVNYLRTTDGYCCLGVACDLYDSSRWQPRAGVFSFIEYEDVLPFEVQHHFGFPVPEGIRFDDDNSLTSLNDDDNESFCEIAERIRRWKANDCEIASR